MEEEDELAPAIVYTPAEYCHGCGHPVGGGRRASGHTIKVVDITQGKASWVAEGRLYGYCESCGQAFQRVIQYIPIECADFPCPGCGSTSGLTTEVLQITEAEEGYSFVALLRCAACSRQSRLSKILRRLSKITKVKVGPTGVEVEMAP